MSRLQSVRERHLDGGVGRALQSAFWAYGGRACGLVWTLSLLATLGFADYGRYAMGFALAAIVAAVVDHPFHVRSVRIPDEDFPRERTLRMTMGFVLLVVAVVAATAGASYILWFGLCIAGFEIVVGAYLSLILRQGRPDVVYRRFAYRQAACVAAGLIYLLAAEQPTLTQASVAYLVPNLMFVLLALPQCSAAKPRWPRDFKSVAIISVENVSFAAYMQGDVLLVGALTNDTVVGYYALASTIGWAVAILGHGYGQTFHGSLRATGGDPYSGPSLPVLVLLSLAGAGVVLLTAAGVAVWGLTAQLSATIAISAAWTFLRSMISGITTILYFQHRDRLRAVSNAVGAVVRLGLIAVLLSGVALDHAAATAAAIAVISESVIAVWLYRAVYGRRAVTHDRGGR